MAARVQAHVKPIEPYHLVKRGPKKACLLLNVSLTSHQLAAWRFRAEGRTVSDSRK